MECCICFEEITVARTIMSCSHTFHLRCLTHWFSAQLGQEMKESCPYCRSEATYLERLPLPAPDGEEHSEEVPVPVGQATLMLSPTAQRWKNLHETLSPVELQTYAISKIVANIRGLWARTSYYIMIGADVKRKRSMRLVKEHTSSMARAAARIKLHLAAAGLSRSEWKSSVATKIQAVWRGYRSRC